MKTKITVQNQTCGVNQFAWPGYRRVRRLALCVAALLGLVASANATLSVVNGDFSDLTGLSPTGGEWYHGTSAGWTSIATRYYSVNTNNTYGDPTPPVPNLDPGVLKQNVGTNGSYPVVTLTFDIGTFNSAPYVTASITDGTTTFASATYTTGTGQTLKALVPSGSPVYVEFVKAGGSGSAWVDNVSVAEGSEHIRNGTFSNGLTDWGFAWSQGGATFGTNANGPTDTSASSGNYAFAGGGTFNILAQTISGVTNGGTYRLTFLAGSKSGAVASGILSLRQESLANYNSASFNYQPSPDAFGSYTVDFAAGAPIDLWLRSDGVNYAAYDNVSVTAIGALTNALNYSAASGTTAITSALSGTGKVTVNAGSGGLSLWAANTYSGGTEVLGGTLYLRGSGRLGGGNVTIASGANLDFGTGSGINFVSNNISGDGQIYQNIANTETRLMGDVTVTGGLTINAGVLRIGSSTATGSYSGNATVASGAQLAFDRTNAYTHGGTISGAGLVAKVAAGTVTLTASNSYSGGTFIYGGTLSLSSAGALGDAAGTVTVNSAAGLYIGGGLTVSRTGNVTVNGGSLTTDNQNYATISVSGGSIIASNAAVLAVPLAGTAGLTVDGAGDTYLWSPSSYTGATVINSGKLVLGGAGAISTNSAVQIASGASFEVTGAYAPNNINRTFAGLTGAGVLYGSGGTVTISKASGTDTFTGDIQGGQGLIKTGAGDLALGGASSYTGTTTVSGGRIVAAHTNALGSTAGGTIVASGAQLMLNGVTTAAEPLTISGVGLPSGSSIAGALRAAAGNSTYQGKVTLAAAAKIFSGSPNSITLDVASGDAVDLGSYTLTVDGSGTNQVNDPIAGTGGVFKTGSGPLILSAASSYSGATTLDNGKLRAGAAAGGLAFGNLSAVTLTNGLPNNPTALELNNFDQTIGSLAGGNVGGNNQGVILGSGMLTTGGNNTSTSFGGVISGTGGLTKAGSGTMTLTAANTYDGSTTVSNGTLLVSGSLAGGAVTVKSGATLGGGGTLGGAVTYETGSKAVLALGSTLSLSSSLTISGSAAVHLNLSNNVPAGNYTLATYSGGSGAFNSTPVIDSGSLAANTHANIVTSGGSVTLQVLPNTVATTLAVSSPSPTSGFHDSVSFSAAVQTNGVTAANATGNVTFKTNGAALSVNALVSGAATSDATSLLPRGTNIITAEYAGDVNYLGSTNTLEQVVTNHPPVANAGSYSRGAVSQWHIFVSELLTNATDSLDGDTLTLVSVGVSTNGITLYNDGTLVGYTNTNLVGDQFSYTVTDGFGGTNSGVITLTASNSVTGTSSITGVITGNPTTLTAYGIPGETYITQRATNLTQVPWEDIATNVLTGTNVVISVTDSNPPLGEAYYRLKWQQP